MKKLNFYTFYILPIILYCSLIFYYSSQPIISGPLGTQLINDKLKHATAYLILAGLTFRAVQQTNYKKYSYLFAIIFATLYGILDEYRQSFVPGRIMSIYDMLANFIGSSLILIRLKKVDKRTQR